MPKKLVLFDVIEDLKSQGVGIIYISHRMEEIFKITDRISVLRDGQYRGTLEPAKTDEDDITQMMIGRKLDLSRNHEHELGDRRPRSEGLSCGALSGCSFSARGRGGRASTVWSVPGAPRSPRPCSACGTPTGGQHHVWKARRWTISSPIDAIAKGISLVPESRKEQGLVLGMNCRDNMTLPQVDDLTAGPFVSDGAEIAIFDQYRDRLEIKAPSWKQHSRVTCRAATSRRS
jgi:ABC-type sugar transport system ATPase subunit